MNKTPSTHMPYLSYKQMSQKELWTKKRKKDQD